MSTIVGYYIEGKSKQFPDAVWCTECAKNDNSPGEREPVFQVGFDVNKKFTVQCDGCHEIVKGYTR